MLNTASIMRGYYFIALVCSIFTTFTASGYEIDRSAVVSVQDQKIAVVENGSIIASYPVSTSRYGLGDRQGSYATPLGQMQVAAKIGEGAPLGAVFKNRHFTGEILRPNAQGRDPIVTRILWLRGLESRNSHAFERNIYIHGTPVERLIGRPASYGCIRMRSRDVVQLFNMMGLGAKIAVLDMRLHRAMVLASAAHGQLAAN